MHHDGQIRLIDMRVAHTHSHSVTLTASLSSSQTIYVHAPVQERWAEAGGKKEQREKELPLQQDESMPSQRGCSGSVSILAQR